MAEQVRFGEVLRREDNRTEVFKISKHMCAANPDVIGENCVENDKGDLAVTEHEKLLAWQEHYERLLNEEFDWNKESLALNGPTIGPWFEFMPGRYHRCYFHSSTAARKISWQ